MPEALNHDDDRGVPLSDMLETLRAQLQRSLERGRGQPVMLAVDKVELELKVSVSRRGKAEAGVQFWVVKAGATGELQRDDVHTFKLSLTPKSAGGAAPLAIGATAVGGPIGG